MTEQFRVDLPRLVDLMEQMRRFDNVLGWALQEANTQVERLHQQWSGAAAQSHRSAHDEWQQGAADLRAGFNAMQEAANTAHSNYTAAIEANVRMWQGTR